MAKLREGKQEKVQDGNVNAKVSKSMLGSDGGDDPASLLGDAWAWNLMVHWMGLECGPGVSTRDTNMTMT